MLRAGDLVHRIAVQETRRVDTDSGGHALTFAHVMTLSARVMTTGGREVMEARKLNAKVSHVVRLRYRGDLTPAHRFVFGGRVLNILAIDDPDGSRVELLAQCEEVRQ